MAAQFGSSPQGMDLLLLWRKKFVILAFAIIGVGIGFGYLRVVPTTYQAQARVLIEPRGLASGLETDGRTNLEFLPTQAETIRSPITVGRALKSVQITPPTGADLEKFNPVLFVLASLRATPVLKANVLTIDYSSTNPEEALALISAVLESYRSDVTEADRGTWATNVEMIAARERDLRHDLEALQSAYVELRQKSPLAGGVGHDATAVALTRMNELGTELAETERRRFDREARLSAVSTALSASHPRPPVTTQAVFGTDDQRGTTTVVALKTVMSRLDSHLLENVLPYAEPVDARSVEEVDQKLRLAKFGFEQLSATYGPKHPDVISAKAEVTEFEERLRQRLQGIVSGWESELQMLKVAQQRLKAAYAEERQQVKNVDVYLVKEQMLQGNIRKIEQLHATTLTQSEQIQAADKAIAEGRSSIQMRILDGPRLLEDMMWPKPKILLAASAVLGLVAGCCLVMLREFIRTSAVAALESHENNTAPSANRDQGQGIAHGHRHHELAGEAT